MEVAPAGGFPNGGGEGGSVATVPSMVESSSSSVEKVIGDVGDDEYICRICQSPGEVDNLLRFPCACSGSIRFAHKDCLLRWLNHSKARQCEVCKVPFSFSPVYLENAPARLPFWKFVVGMAMEACRVLQFFLHLISVLSVWFLISPFIAFWILRLAFVRSFGEAQRLFMSHMSTTVLFTDWAHGSLLFAAVFLISSGADYIRQLRERGGQEAERNRARVRVYELVGMQGHVLYMVLVVLLAVCTMAMIGVVIFVPFSLGRVILYYLSWDLSSATTPVMSTVMPLTDSALSLSNITLKNSLTAVANLTNENHKGSLLHQVAGMQKANVTGVNELSNNINSAFPSQLLKGRSVGALGMSDFATLAVGYIFIYLCPGILTLIRYTRVDRFYAIASTAETIQSLSRKFVVAMRHLMTTVKAAFFLAFELAVFPLMCGWWLDVCTLRMFGKSIGNRVEFFSISPLASSLLHWIVGIIYIREISIYVSLLRGVLRNGVLCFLQDPHDPNYDRFRSIIDNPVPKYACRILLWVPVFGSLIVMLVFLPLKIAMRVAPAIFPLDISVSDPFTEIPIDLLLFQICIPFATDHIKMQTTIKSLLCYWFTVVGWALGLTDYLLPRPVDNGGNENVNVDQGRHEKENVEHAVDDVNMPIHVAVNPNILDGGEHAKAECGFVLRIVLLLVLAWTTLLIINSALIVIQVAFARTLFNGLPPLPVRHGVKCNDFYALVIGSYVIWAAVAGVRYSIEDLKSRRATPLVKQIWKWGSIVIISSALLLLWIFVIPVLIGLLFELLVILPMRVSVDESPVFLLYQDWALGLIFLEMWTMLVMLDENFPLLYKSWRSQSERVMLDHVLLLVDGFSRLQGFRVLREIVYPIIMKLLTALCVPYVLSRGVFPVFGYPLVVNSAVYRFAWLGCLGLALVCYSAKRFHVWLTKLHDSIWHDTHLIGRRLEKFGFVQQRRNNKRQAPNIIYMNRERQQGNIGLIRWADVGNIIRWADV